MHPLPFTGSAIQNHINISLLFEPRSDETKQWNRKKFEQDFLCHATQAKCIVTGIAQVSFGQRRRGIRKGWMSRKKWMRRKQKHKVKRRGKLERRRVEGVEDDERERKQRRCEKTKGITVREERGGERKRRGDKWEKRRYKRKRRKTERHPWTRDVFLNNEQCSFRTINTINSPQNESRPWNKWVTMFWVPRRI